MNISKIQVEQPPFTLLQTGTPLVAVYCGAKEGNDPIFKQTISELGTALAKANLGVVYGGASVGLMGAVADSALEHGAPVVGILPEFMTQWEVQHTGLTKLHIVESMHVRKQLIADYASAFIAFPGGFGTLDEIMEIATWSQIELHDKPMILLNINGYYDALITHLQNSIATGLLSESHSQALVVCNSVDEATKYLQGL